MKLVDLTFGIDAQAMSVAYLLSKRESEVIDIANTAPWYNGRERGVVFTFSRYNAGGRKVLNIAVFEHRNSDALCALKWFSGPDINPPNMTTHGEEAYHGGDKYNVAHQVKYGQIVEMVQWIVEQIESDWEED